MKFDIFKILNAINLGIDIAGKFKKHGGVAPTGPEKLQIAKESAAPLINAMEGVIGKDLIKEERIAPLVDDYVAIVIKLSKAVAEVKALKADPTPAS
jgi:hypothetical protein